MANRSLILFALFIAITLLPGVAAAQKKTGGQSTDPKLGQQPAAEEKKEEPAVTFKFHGQERARFELMPEKQFDGGSPGYWQIGNRARIGLQADFGKVASVFVQVQDVRTWGSEYNAANDGEGTLFDPVANGLDMHQAYGQLNFMYDIKARVGRQEIAWNGQRLIGAVGWSHQGRSFDAVRIWKDSDPFGFDVFYALMLNRPVSSTDTNNRWKDQHLIALRAGPRVGDALKLDGLAIVNIDAATELNRVTFGVHGTGNASIFAWEAEAYGQVGSDSGVDYRAFMFGVRAGVNLSGGPNPYIGGGFDYLSGDDDATDTTVKTFDTLYATNHKFYGHMDLYLAIPAHTRGEGLIDGQLNTHFKFSKKVGLKFDAHVFASAQPASGSSAFHGLEFDTNAYWKVHKVVKVMGGVWVYAPGDWFAGDDPEVGLYAMTDFNFK